MKPKNAPDLALGVLFAIAGLFILTQALGYQSMPGLPVGPGLFPTITGGAMAVFGLVLAVQGWTLRSDGLTLVPEGGDGVDSAEEVSERVNPPLLNVFAIGILATVAATIIVMPMLGFLITGALFTFVVVKLGGGRWLSALIFSPIASIVVYAVFFYGFRVPLPRGILG